MAISASTFQIETLLANLEEYVLPKDRPLDGKKSIISMSSEYLEANLKDLEGGLQADLKRGKYFNEKDITLAYRLRRTLEAAIMAVYCSPHETSLEKLKDLRVLQNLKNTNISILRSLLPLTPLNDVKIDLTTAYTLNTPLLPPLCEIVLDYFGDQNFAHSLISTGYEEMSTDETRIVGQEKANRGYDLLRRFVCHQNLPLQFRRVCTWDLYQLAKKPECLHRMDLNEYASSPNSLLRMIFLLEWADQIRPSTLVASVLARTQTPLNLNSIFPFLAKQVSHVQLDSIFPSFLVKRAEHIQRVILDTTQHIFPMLLAHSIPSDTATKILARSLAPINNARFCLRSTFIPQNLLPSVNWPVLVRNISNDFCLNLEYDREFSTRLFTELEKESSTTEWGKQNSLKKRHGILKIVVNSIVYGHPGKIENRPSDISFDELLPLLLMELRKIVDLGEQAYERHGSTFFSILETIRYDPDYHQKYLEIASLFNELLQYIADHLTETAFLPFENESKICVEILKLMPNDDRRNMIMANSILRNRKAVYTLIKAKLARPSTTQIVESLRIYLIKNMAKFNDLPEFSDGNYNVLFAIDTNHDYLTREHIEFILNHLPPEHIFLPLYQRSSIKIINEMDPKNPVHNQILKNTRSCILLERSRTLKRKQDIPTIKYRESIKKVLLAISNVLKDSDSSLR